MSIRNIWGKQFSNAVEVFVPVSNAWNNGTAMPVTVDKQVSSVIDDKIYAISSGLIQICDAANGNWSLEASPPLFDYVMSSAATTGILAPKRVYVFAYKQGTEGQSNQGFEAQCYDPESRSWTVATIMPTNRFGSAVAVLDDKLYVIGGETIMAPKTFSFNPTTALSSINEQYTPIGFETPDPSYQSPTPPPNPTSIPMPTPTLTPSPAPSVTQSPSASPSPTPSPSRQPTPSPKPSDNPIPPTEIALITVAVAIAVFIAAIAISQRHKR